MMKFKEHKLKFFYNCNRYKRGCVYDELEVIIYDKKKDKDKIRQKTKI